MTAELTKPIRDRCSTEPEACGHPPLERSGIGLTSVMNGTCRGERGSPRPRIPVARFDFAVISAKKSAIFQWIASMNAIRWRNCLTEVGHTPMRSRMATSLALAVSLLLLVAPPGAQAQDGTIRTKSGDIGLERSDEASELAIRARELFETGMRKRDPRKLAAAAEIMNRIPDQLDLRTDETAPPVNMAPRSAAAGERRTSGLSPILMKPRKVIDLAIGFAIELGDAGLAQQLRRMQSELPKSAQQAPGQKSCVWANCCGRWGCWRWCQWW